MIRVRYNQALQGSLLTSIRVVALCASLWAWGRLGQKSKQPRKFMTFLKGTLSDRYLLFQPPAEATPNRALSHRSVLLRLRRFQQS
jgi:hypothetical protein